MYLFRDIEFIYLSSAAAGAASLAPSTAIFTFVYRVLRDGEQKTQSDTPLAKLLIFRRINKRCTIYKHFTSLALVSQSNVVVEFVRLFDR